ncbi:MAG: DUF933 domain-containing protein [Candidatus Eisenbacteria bacterium]
MRVGIVGFPLSGKTTVFNALTHGAVRTGCFSAGREEVHLCVTEVPDERVRILEGILAPKKINRAKIEYVDVAGVERGSARQTDSAVQFLAPVRQADALLHVARAFRDECVPRSLGSVDAARDVVALEEEFVIADLLAVERRLEKVVKQASVGKKPEEKGETEALEKCRESLLAEKPLREVEFTADEERIIRGFQFLSFKPVLVVVNEGEDADCACAGQIAKTWSGERRGIVSVCGKLEMEIGQAPQEDVAELMEIAGLAEPASLRVIRASYELLGLITFYTTVHSELSAWPVRKGTGAAKAAGEIHTDLERGFIRAEVASFVDLVACGSIAAARERGALRTEGKTYEVCDGDVMTVKFAT